MLVGMPVCRKSCTTAAKRDLGSGCRWRSLPPSVAMNGLGKPDSTKFDKPHQLEYATGCALMVRRAVLETTHGFDRDLENYMERLRFCYRLRKAGYSMDMCRKPGCGIKSHRPWGSTRQSDGSTRGRNTVCSTRRATDSALVAVDFSWLGIAKGGIKGH